MFVTVHQRLFSPVFVSVQRRDGPGWVEKKQPGETDTLCQGRCVHRCDCDAKSWWMSLTNRNVAQLNLCFPSHLSGKVVTTLLGYKKRIGFGFTEIHTNFCTAEEMTHNQLLFLPEVVEAWLRTSWGERRCCLLTGQTLRNHYSILWDSVVKVIIYKLVLFFCSAACGLLYCGW